MIWNAVVCFALGGTGKGVGMGDGRSLASLGALGKELRTGKWNDPPLLE